MGAREDHDDRPGCGQLDDPGADIAHEEFSVQFEDDILETVVFIVQLQYREGLRMDIDAELLRSFVHQNLRSGGRRVRQFVGVERGTGDCDERGLHLRVGARPLRDGEMVVRAVEEVLDLGLEEIDRAGEREPKNKRDTEETGIEVPAPDSAIIQSS